MTSAVIVGCDGQDGALLWDYLSDQGYELCGVSRKGVRGRFGLPASVDVCDPVQVNRLMEELRPEEVYYLAAFHHSSEDNSIVGRALYERSQAIHVDGLINFLEGMKRHTPQARLFYAASPLMFGSTATCPQNEMTPISPECVYGITKAHGFHLVRYYRSQHGLFASSGILYNHESPLRGARFVTQKIIMGALEIKQGRRSQLILGDLLATADWGYALDVVAAMHGILQIDTAEDFVVATGCSHSVGDFVEITFELLNLDWRQYVSQDKNILTRRRTSLIGDSAKLKRTIGWQPSVDLKGLIQILLAAKGAFDA